MLGDVAVSAWTRLQLLATNESPTQYTADLPIAVIEAADRTPSPHRIGHRPDVARSSDPLHREAAMRGEASALVPRARRPLFGEGASIYKDNWAVLGAGRLEQQHVKEP